jgi:acyl carrier protein
VGNFLFGDAARKPADADSLIENGIVDSTGILELIEYLESEFGISVQEDETIPQNLDGLGVLTRFVTLKLAQA